MKNLYWITILGHINTAVLCLLILSIGASVFFGIWYVIVYDTTHDPKNSAEVEKAKKFSVCSIMVSVITAILTIFIPSSHELYFIYGVGTTIDWVNEHPDAKQLPEKTVQVLNKMVDDYINKEEK